MGSLYEVKPHRDRYQRYVPAVIDVNALLRFVKTDRHLWHRKVWQR